MDYPSIQPSRIAYSPVFLLARNGRAQFVESDLARMRERVLLLPALVHRKYPEQIYVLDDVAQRDEVAGFQEILYLGMNGVCLRRDCVEVELSCGGVSASMLIEFCRWCLLSISCQMRGAGGVIHSIADLTKPEGPPATGKTPKKQRR